MQFKVIIIFAVCLGYVAPSITKIMEKKGEVVKAALGVKMAGAHLAIKGVEAALDKKKMIVNAVLNSSKIKESISAKKKKIAGIVKDVAEFKGNLLLKAISLGKSVALSAFDMKKAIIAAKLQSKPDSGKPCDIKDNTPTTAPPHHNPCVKPKSIDVYEVQPSGVIVESPVVYRLSPPNVFYGNEEVEFI